MGPKPYSSYQGPFLITLGKATRPEGVRFFVWLLAHVAVCSLYLRLCPGTDRGPDRALVWFRVQVFAFGV